MKTRKLLALLLLLPLLTYCDKKNPDPIEDDPIDQPEPEPVVPVDEDPYAEAAQEVKNGDLILVTNERMQAFLEDVTYPERDYSETHILDEKYGPTAPGNADKPQEYSIRWTKADAEGDKTVKLWEDDGWSREVKEIYDTYRNLKLVLSGSSLLQLNDGKADLSRRVSERVMPGLSFREFLLFDAGIHLEPYSLEDLLKAPSVVCSSVLQECHPLEFFRNYLEYGYYPFFLESRKDYASRVENVVNYIIDTELTQHRGLEVGNTRKVKALLQVLSVMLPYEVDIAKLSRTIGIERKTVLKYLTYLEEANLIRRLFTDLDSITDLQKPDKILLDNTNLLFTLSSLPSPEIGTVRETFFCNQIVAAGHKVEYGGLKTGDFRIEGKVVIEVGGPDKGFEQIKNEKEAYVAADGIESAQSRKIPLWAFGFLY